MLQAFYLGAGFYSDAFTIAYRIPNLLRRVLGEGGMSASFIPVFSEVRKKKEEEKAWQFAGIFFWDMVVIVGIITVLGIIFSPILVRLIAGGFGDIPGKLELTIHLNRIIFPFIFFISLTSIAMAILNSFGKFSLPAATPIFYNITIISIVLIFARSVNNKAVVFAIGVVLGGFSQFFSQVPLLLKIGMRFKPDISFKDEDIRKIGKLIFPVIIGASAIQIQILIGSYIASTLLPEGSVSYLYYADRVMELTLGVFSVALATVLLPLLSDLAASRETEKMKETIRFSIKLTAFLTIPAATGLIALSDLIINVLFQRGAFSFSSTKNTAFALCFYAIGLPSFAAVKLLLQVFFSMKDTATPVKIGIVAILIDIAGSLILIKFLSHGGIALALSLAGLANMLLLWIFMEKKIGKIITRNLAKDVVKIAFSSAIMGFILYYFKNRMSFFPYIFTLRMGILFFMIGAGIIIYLIFSLLFFRKSLMENFKMIRKRR